MMEAAVLEDSEVFQYLSVNERCERVFKKQSLTIEKNNAVVEKRASSSLHM